MRIPVKLYGYLNCADGTTSNHECPGTPLISAATNARVNPPNLDDLLYCEIHSSETILPTEHCLLNSNPLCGVAASRMNTSQCQAPVTPTISK